MAVLLILFSGTPLPPPAAHAGRVLNDTPVTRPFGHHLWQDVIRQYIDTRGYVDWTALQASPRRLNQYLDQLAQVSPDNQPDYFPTPQDKLAYWLNAHNAIAMRLILDAYPVGSTESIPGFEHNMRYVLGGKPVSLAILRLKISARIPRHPDLLFTLTDYSRGAPALLPAIGAYEGHHLKKQLPQARKAALGNPDLIGFDSPTNICPGLTLSGFFRTYEPAVFTKPAWEDEDRDRIEPDDTPDTGARNWLNLLHRYAPPAVYAELGKSCPHPVRFMNSNRRLRSLDTE